ncbi:MAG: MraZ N-terminal domain containing protein, partial [Candidatus Omnitrophica bacterium]|nr:MraZ N-terminal domain containing protein [Candidatus Omnitrophota bacterium]
MKILINDDLREYLKTNDYKKVVLTRGKTRCVYMFTAQEWKKLEDKFT